MNIRLIIIKIKELQDMNQILKKLKLKVDIF